MTVSAQTLAFEYTANGVTTTFPYQCRILFVEQLKVYVDGVIQVGGYTVFNVGNQNGGDVVFSVAPASGSTVLIRRISDRVRTTDFQQAPYFTQEELLDLDQDYQTMLLQEAAAEGDKSIRIPSEETVNTILPSAAERAGKQITFGANGEVALTNTAAAIAGADLVFAATKAAADSLAAGLGDGATVIVDRDEIAGGVQTRRVVTSGVLGAPVNELDAGQVKFTQVGAGAVDRTAQDKGEELKTSADYSTLQQSIDAADQGKLQLKGTNSITATLTATNPLIIEGDGAFGPTDAGGSVINNTTNDVIALHLNGTAGRLDRVQLRDFRINHEAATKYAVHFENAPFGAVDNLEIECGGVGYGGILLGDENAIPIQQGYLGSIRNTRIWNFKTYGVRVNSPGTLWDLTGCHVSSTFDGAIAGYFNKEGTYIRGGQWGANNLGGIALSDYNTSNGDREGNTFEGQVFESVSNKCVSFDGATNAVVGGIAKNQYANLISVSGTVCFFGRAKKCRFEFPRIKNPTSGGTLCEWGANSQDCILECDYDAAQAPIVVSGSATRAVKIVRGRLTRPQAALVTTSANLTTIIPDGIEGLPVGFIPVHNGTAWNYQFVIQGNGTATSFTPPRTKGLVRVMSQGTITTTGAVAYDVSTPAASVLYSGGDLEASVLALVGTTGTNNKITVGANGGLIYVENRLGAANNNITVLFEANAFGVA